MSQWHREHPELAGTDADPWMANPGHRRAHEQLVREGHIDCPDCDGRRVVWEPCGCNECEYDDKHSRYIPCATCRPEAV